jgi:catechol 2,3-dioxygenase-like lactoylglutathione lyase family enzyme
MSLIKVQGIAYIRFQAPDLQRMRTFLCDFGLSDALPGSAGPEPIQTPAQTPTDSLAMRGCGPAPFLHHTQLGEAGFLGFAFHAASLTDLGILSKHEACPIEPILGPGGGFRVRLTDPDGVQVDVVTAQKEAAIFESPARPALNTVLAPMRFSERKEMATGPAHPWRLGHCVLGVADFKTSELWYKSRFGLITSDEVCDEQGTPFGAFMRCDRGPAPTDHHSLFLIKARGKPGFNHAQFEVQDMDDLCLGHEHLAARGYARMWGVGRHLIGSNVFDYWYDPWGHSLEHGTDVDLLTADDGSRKISVAQLMAVQWGDVAPRPFIPDKHG